MSQIDYEFIPMEELINASDGIYIVEKKEPCKQIELIPIIMESPNKYPPHRRFTYQFTIISTLYGPDTPGPGDEIIVRAAHDDIDFNLDRRFYLKGREGSATLFAYNSAVDIYSEDDFIIFVSRLPGKEDAFQFPAENAYLLTKEQDKVKKLVDQMR
ncbi:MAG: hypothetical protein JXJ04_19485 [Spirochaetales bacterium]|nr:hypothetical protein [Spirochaetales bacterium]